MKIEAIIFDMDGVLTGSMRYHIASWKYAFNKFNIFPADEDLALLEGMSYKETINNISQRYSIKLNNSKKEEIYSIKKEKLSKIFQYKTYPKVIEMLNFLKNKKIRLAVVSGANKKFVKDVVSNLFPNFFEIIITGSDVRKGKPNPESFLKAIKDLNCDPENILVIENAPLGIESAKKANLKTYALATTLDVQFLGDANKVFHSHEELLRELKKMLEK